MSFSNDVVSTYRVDAELDGLRKASAMYRGVTHEANSAEAAVRKFMRAHNEFASSAQSRTPFIPGSTSRNGRAQRGGVIPSGAYGPFPWMDMGPPGPRKKVLRDYETDLDQAIRIGNKEHRTRERLLNQRRSIGVQMKILEETMLFSKSQVAREGLHFARGGAEVAAALGVPGSENLIRAFIGIQGVSDMAMTGVSMKLHSQRLAYRQARMAQLQAKMVAAGGVAHGLAEGAAFGVGAAGAGRLGGALGGTARAAQQFRHSFELGTGRTASFASNRMASEAAVARRLGYLNVNSPEFLAEGKRLFPGGIQNPTPASQQAIIDRLAARSYRGYSVSPLAAAAVEGGVFAGGAYGASKVPWWKMAGMGGGKLALAGAGAGAVIGGGLGLNALFGSYAPGSLNDRIAQAETGVVAGIHKFTGIPLSHFGPLGEAASIEIENEKRAKRAQLSQDILRRELAQVRMEAEISAPFRQQRFEMGISAENQIGMFGRPDSLASSRFSHLLTSNQFERARSTLDFYRNRFGGSPTQVQQGQLNQMEAQMLGLQERAAGGFADFQNQALGARRNERLEARGVGAGIAGMPAWQRNRLRSALDRFNANPDALLSAADQQAIYASGDTNAIRALAASQDAAIRRRDPDVFKSLGVAGARGRDVGIDDRTTFAAEQIPKQLEEILKEEKAFNIAVKKAEPLLKEMANIIQGNRKAQEEFNKRMEEFKKDTAETQRQAQERAASNEVGIPAEL